MVSEEKIRELIEEWREDADERLHPGEAGIIYELADQLEETIDDE